MSVEHLGDWAKLLTAISALIGFGVVVVKWGSSASSPLVRAAVWLVVRWRMTLGFVAGVLMTGFNLLIPSQVMLPGWLVAYGGVFSAYAIVMAIDLWRRDRRLAKLYLAEPESPRSLTYVCDWFYGLVWRWSYEPTKTGHSIMWIRAFCPKAGCRLELEARPVKVKNTKKAHLGFWCRDCDKLHKIETGVYSLAETEQAIRNAINRKVRLGCYRPELIDEVFASPPLEALSPTPQLLGKAND